MSCLNLVSRISLQRCAPPFRTIFASSQRCFSSSVAEGLDMEYRPEQRKQDLDYCISVVRERDLEGFYCGLLMPAKTQKAYFVLRAFNAELASIKTDYYVRNRGRLDENRADLSKNFALQMRLEWWMNSIRQIFGEQTMVMDRSSDPSTSMLAKNIAISCWKSPIVRALNAAHKEVGFTRRFLERLIEAREVDLGINQFNTMDDATKYADQTVSSLLYLSLECLGIRDDAADEAASYAGLGIGLTTALRGTPVRLMDGEVTIPSDLLPSYFPYDSLQYQVIQNTSGGDDKDKGDSYLDEELQHKLTDEMKQLWQEAVQTMTFTASSYLAKARDKQSQVPKQGRTALLPVVPALHYLSRLEKAKYNVLDPELLQPDRFRVMFLLGRTWLTGVF